MKTLIIAVLLFSIGQAIASPVVIYDNGKAINAQQFYPFKKPSKAGLNKLRIPQYQKKVLKQFPVVSSMLSVGKVRARKVKNKLPRPICLVGDDKQSKNWIKRKHLVLSAINALCIVVNVESKRRFQFIKALAPDIDFQALNGNIFAKQLKIKHYPLLLNQKTISQ